LDREKEFSVHGNRLYINIRKLTYAISGACLAEGLNRTLLLTVQMGKSLINLVGDNLTAICEPNV
jgi:hypothetical protein